MGAALRAAAAGESPAARMTTTRDAAIVIPTFNAGSDLERLLAALLGQQGPFRPRVIAIDSGSTDGTPDLLRRCGATVLSVTQAEFNHGVTRNLALAHADTEFAVLTVQDAVPASPHWLTSLLTPMLDDA